MKKLDQHNLISAGMGLCSLTLAELESQTEPQTGAIPTPALARAISSLHDAHAAFYEAGQALGLYK